MENHPIPQDVTGFQFKLVGNMTLKQFAYVAAGAILSVVVYYLPFPGLLKFFLIFIFSMTGVALAFLPIEGRPLDTMAMNFFHAVTRPNQYAYHKLGGKLSFTDLDLQPVSQQKPVVAPLLRHQAPGTQNKEAKLREYLYELEAQPKSAIDEKEMKYMSALFGQTTGGTTPLPKGTPQSTINPRPQVQQVPQMPPPSQQFVQMPVSEPVHTPIPQQTPEPAQQMAPPAAPIVAPVLTSPAYQPPPLPATQPAQPIVTQAQPVIPVAIPVPQQTQQPVSMPIQQTAPVPPAPVAQVNPPVVQIPQEPVIAPAAQAVPAPEKAPAQNTGVPTLPGFPNLITGIIKDPRGNVLSGILVDVKNKDGDSVRAFKTNPLGQFASATQLPSGMYTLEFEDPKHQHNFDKVQLDVNGSILTPLEVISVDAREELRKSLFG